MICSKVIFTAIILLSAVALSAQTMLLNQAYLNEFPTVERVRAEVKGSDEVDTYARFMAALWILNGFLINDLRQAPNGGYYEMPPAADQVASGYGSAITKLTIDHPEPPSKDPRFRPLRDKYSKDPVFIDSVLLKFFTPRFRADYYAWTRKPMPATTTAANSASSSPAVDPSIAAANAAKVDLSLFANSIRFGDPLKLPRCPYNQNMGGGFDLGNITQDCEDIQPPVTGMAAGLLGVLQSMAPQGQAQQAPKPDPNVRHIILIQNHRPSWMTGAGAWVRISPSGIERVVFYTFGRDVENRVAAELKTKYGPRFTSQEHTITPDVGNAFKVHNLEWALPGLHVEYRVIESDENGRLRIDGNGFVRIETQSAYERRIADEKKPQQTIL
jgi:hypothetical protein